MPKFLLELDEEHAHALSAACDFFVRCNLGQFKELTEMWFRKGWQVETGVPQIPDEEHEAVEHHMDRVKKLLTGHDSNSSFGIGNRAVGKDGHIAYEIEKLVRQALWREKGKKDEWCVDASPPLAVSGHPFPKIFKTTDLDILYKYIQEKEKGENAKNPKRSNKDDPKPTS